MGSDECHFNVSFIVRDKVTRRQCPQTTTFEEKGEPKRIRTEVPLFTSLTPYRWAKSAHTPYIRFRVVDLYRDFVVVLFRNYFNAHADNEHVKGWGGLLCIKSENS